MSASAGSVTGSGSSSNTDSIKATNEAFTAASQRLGGRKAAAAVVFAGPDHDLRAITNKLGELTGRAQIIGCSTAGEFTEAGLTHNGVALMLIASEDKTFGSSLVGELKGSPERAAANLVSAAQPFQREAKEKNRVFHDVIALVDPLGGAGDRSILELRRGLGNKPQIVGGAAGDEGRFKRTVVSGGGKAGPDALSVLHVFGDHPLGVGVDNGLEPATETMQVTKASGSVVYEINGRPAFDVYKEFARSRSTEITPSTAGPFLIKHEIGILVLGKLRRARAPLTVGADGSLSCAAEVPEGAPICILDGKPERLVNAAQNAAKEARERLKGREAAGVVVFDCICRGIILEKQFQKEIDSVAEVFPKVPITGFLTYGEIARYGGQLDVWHNTTAVVVAIPR